MKRLSKEEIIELCKMYETGNYNFKDLDRHFDLGLGSCRGLLLRRGYKAKSNSEINRKYSLNESYFNEINTPEKAYFLGFIYADGCNFPEGTRLVINLHQQDKHILEEFQKLLGYNRPLKYKKATKTTYGNSNPQYALTVSSKIISDQLTKLGVVKNKTLILEFPKWLNPDLYSHFIRGYFDGDGCITGVKAYISKNGQSLHYDWSIVGTEDFVSKVQEIMINELGLSKTKIRKQGKVSYLEYSGNKQCKRIGEWMYKDSTIHLTRKYNKFKLI